MASISMDLSILTLNTMHETVILKSGPFQECQT